MKRPFLGVHEADIERHQPEFSAGQLGEADLAFQVQSGDETVGVVLIRGEGEVARVLLDYVTPRYRDFSPGEFVWRQATLLRNRGFRKGGDAAGDAGAVLRPPAPGLATGGAGLRHSGK